MAFVQRLRDLNVRVWIDYGNIDGALLWGQEIVEAIEECRVLILMASESSVSSPNVVKEVTLASENRKYILPLHLEPIAIPKSLKWHLAGIQHIELFRGNDESNFHAVARSLERLGVNIGATPQKTLRPPPSPTNETETTEEQVASKQPEADQPTSIADNAESAAHNSVPSPGVPYQPDSTAVNSKEASPPASVLPRVTVISPADGETLLSGTTQEIKWEASSKGAELESIRIEISWSKSLQATRASDVFTITPPPSHLPGSAVVFQWDIPPMLGARQWRRVLDTDYRYMVKIIARDKLGREGFGTAHFRITKWLGNRWFQG